MDGLGTSRIPLLLLAEVQKKRVRGEELDSLIAATFIYLRKLLRILLLDLDARPLPKPKH